MDAPITLPPESLESPKILETLNLDLIEGPEKSAQFSRLLDESFSVPAGAHFFDDFPVWNEAVGPHSDRVFRVGVWQREELVSCAGVRLADLRVPAGDLKVALMGAVATAPSARGRGLASRTVSIAVEWARERGAALVLLWGSELHLYERLGFELCGMQVRVPLSQLDLGPDPDFARVVLGRGWIPSLLRCLRLRGTGIRHSGVDERWLEAHKNVQWYWLGDPETPLAYAAIDRGIDLQGVVHEWGGESSAAIKVLLHLIKMERPEAQLLASPDLLSAWQLGAPRAEVEFLCMARALDVPKISAAYGLALSKDDPLMVTPNMAACRLFFGPAEGALPLWLWGLDAV
ncbi:GNAT family N-acetyltransferase [Bdellovibrionota bacterium FG-1]